MDAQIGGALIGAGASMASGLLSASSARDANAANVNLNEETRRFNAEQAQVQRDWEERMSSTAYQRQVADMKAAGINPIAGFGSGATTPSGATATAPTRIPMSPVPSFLDGVVSSAGDLLRSVANAMNVKRQGELLESQKKFTDVQSSLGEAKTPGEAIKGRGWKLLNSIIDRIGEWSAKAMKRDSSQDFRLDK